MQHKREEKSGTKRYEIQLNCEEAKKKRLKWKLLKRTTTQTVRTEQSHTKETITCKTNVFN
jgi:hypothetical protein